MSNSGESGEQKPSLWWLSYCRPDLPVGEQFMGVVIVEANSFLAATYLARHLDLSPCEPSGEVVGLEEVMEIVESTKGKTVTREDDNMDKYVASLAERLKDE